MSLQIIEQNNAIIVPLEIKLDRLDDLKKVVQELKQVDLSAIETTGSGASDEQMTTAIEKHMKKLFPQTATEGLQDVTQLFTNPKGFLMSIISNPYVAAALVAAGLGVQIMNWMMVQGNILDKHFKRIIASEQLAGIRREQRKQTQTGLGRQVIFTSHSGSNEPEYAFNSFEARRSGDIDSMTAFQIRRGYKF